MGIIGIYHKSLHNEFLKIWTSVEVEKNNINVNFSTFIKMNLKSNLYEIKKILFFCK